MADDRQNPEQASAERTPNAPPAADARPAGAANEAAAGEPEGGASDASGAEGFAGATGPAMPGDAAALAEAQARVAEYHDAFLRAKAEMENVRRRAQEDVAKAHKYAVEKLAEALVPVADSLEAALATQGGTPEQLREGVEITLRQLTAAFEKAKLAPIDPKGERFDPNRHQAISMVPSAEVPAQHVVTVLQKGWMLAERVLRPALVTVSNGAGG